MCHAAGLFSSTMRELTSVGHDGPKWIVLDGDIDPMWIESLNTVMDDNKVKRLRPCHHSNTHTRHSTSHALTIFLPPRF